MQRFYILAILFFITVVKSYSNNDLYYYDGKPMLLHFNSVPLYYNPSFAGTTGKTRLSINYLNNFIRQSKHNSMASLHPFLKID